MAHDQVDRQPKEMAKKRGNQEQKHLRVEIRHVTTAHDAERLSRAIGILLRAGTRGSKDSVNTQKEEPTQNSPLTKAVEKKDESCGKKARTTKGDT